MIDINTLRIGTHVEYEGKRYRVVSLIETTQVGVVYGRRAICYIDADALNPIEITPSLLTELGFKYCHKCFYGEWEKRLAKKYLCFSAISDGLWRVLYVDGCDDMWNCACRYLHEAEAFLALYNIELIEG